MKDAWFRLLDLEEESDQAAKLARLTAVFDEIDINHDGLLQRAEIDAYFTLRFGSAPQFSLLSKMIEICDADHNGAIDREELASVVQ